MENHSASGSYANISQRAADSFRRMLAGGSEGPLAQAHAFFEELYEALYTRPADFGLPVSEDLCIGETEANPKEKKQEVKRQLDKPRGMIMAALDFLQWAGAQGHLEGTALALEGVSAALKQTQISKRFLEGLKSLGLTLTVSGEPARLEHTHRPGLAAELQALARGCAAYADPNTAKFQFARCDPRALRQADPDPAELYRCFDEQEHAPVMELHEFFDAKGYKTVTEVNGALAWVVKYQGSRKVKGTPLFQIERDDRHARPLRMQIKCASAQRIAELLPEQPALLQEDFLRRTNRCNGDRCGWCHNNKTLGPTQLEINGQTRTVCWYVNPDIRQIDETTVPLVQQYEAMHAQLA